MRALLSPLPAKERRQLLKAVLGELHPSARLAIVEMMMRELTPVEVREGGGGVGLGGGEWQGGEGRFRDMAAEGWEGAGSGSARGGEGEGPGRDVRGREVDGGGR